jgi:hypothetical protein
MIEILLSGEFRTGARCAKNWKKIPNANITLCVDSASVDMAKSAYPNATVVGLDWKFYPTNNNPNKIYYRWQYYTATMNFSDDQLVIVSRPDLYITDIRPLIQEIQSSHNKVMINYDDNAQGANDILFVVPFGIFKRMISEYSEFSNFDTPYKTHEYLYYISKKFNARGAFYHGRICRPNIPDEVEITIQTLTHYDSIYKSQLLNDISQ